MTGEPLDRLLALWGGRIGAGALSAEEWDRLVRVARQGGVLARLASLLEERGELAAVPADVRPVLVASRSLAEAHGRNIRWEVRRIAEALGHAGLPFVLLKGAAYVMEELPPARGRLFEDVDVLVARDELARAESALQLYGWVGSHRDPYDQRYYRRWMHQIPPLRHGRRGTTIDVHHNLLPDTGPLRPDPDLLRATSRELPGWPGVRLPCPEDLVLHSAAHLFHDGAMENGLRDLMDLDGLLRHYGEEPAFWSRLDQRARLMNLTGPLGDALRWTRRLLGTPVPPAAIAGGAAPEASPLRRGYRDFLFRHGLRPDHPLCRGALTRPAGGLLYLRSHFLRMPLRLLAPHLVRKALRGAAT